MKKLIALLLALIMVLSLGACGAKPETTEAPAEATESALSTLVPGKLTVATSPDFAPYEFYAIDENGDPQLAGFDVALAKYIADYLGLELEIVPMDFDGVLAEVTTGSVDLGMSGLSPDPERQDAMDFSDIYYQSGQAFVTTNANASKFAELADANNPDYAIGAQTGSIQYNLAQENAPDADIIALTKVTDIIQELLGGKLDGAFIEAPVAKAYQATYPELNLLFEVPYDNTGSVVGVRKGHEDILKAVNEAINAALSDGSMNTFIAEAQELATGEVYEGLLENGAAPAENETPVDTSIS